MKLKNEDGTYNVYNWEDECYFKVDSDYLENINLEQCICLELVPNGNKPSRLKVVKEEQIIWYENIHGSWGFPTVFN